MLKQLVAVSALASFALLGPAPAAAQDFDAGIKVDVPFAFTLGRTTLPEGDYLIRRQSGPMATTFLITETDRGDAHALFTIVEGQAPVSVGNHDEIQFMKVGDRYFLSSIDAEGTALTLARSRTERRLLASGVAVILDASPHPIGTGR